MSPYDPNEPYEPNEKMLKYVFRSKDFDETAFEYFLGQNDDSVLIAFAEKYFTGRNLSNDQVAIQRGIEKLETETEGL